MQKPKRSSDFALGIDGGGSKTLAIVVDAQGNERGRGQSGSTNYAAVGINQAVNHIRSAAEEAARAANCPLPLHAAWLGLAGIDRPDDCNKLLPYLHSLARIVCLTNDAELVLSALEGTVGIALIAGTGSIALGRNIQGTITRVGGWGHIFGDEGSGYEIGRQGLQAAARSADGREPRTALLELIMEEWKLNIPSDLIGKVYHEKEKASIAQLSTLVFKAARNGDEMAQKIIEQAANELALAAITVGNTLDRPGETLPIALSGGLLLHEEDFREQVLQAIRQHRPIGQVALVTQPALSAARAAIQLH